MSALLAPLVSHVVHHGDLNRLLANWPLAGVVTVVDSGSLVADLQAAMRTNHVWRTHIVFREAPTTSAVVDAMIGGATDYLAWPCTTEEVAERMKAWGSRSAEIRRRMEGKKRAQRLLAKLTNRELEILNLVALGMTSAEIGAVLKLTPKTVEIHRYRMLQKLELKRSAKAIKLVFEAQY